MWMAIAALAALTAGQSLSGDFDQDGRPDTAVLVEQAPGRFALVVRRGAGPAMPIIEVAKAEEFYIRAAEEGLRATACGKGSGRDGAPCPEREVSVPAGALVFGTQETSEAVALWDGGRFRVVWLSD
jgi:hypothetical protein